MNAAIGFAVILVISIVLNVSQFFAMGGLREKLTKAGTSLTEQTERRTTAESAAKTCSDATAGLVKAAEDQRKAWAAEIAKAKQDAKTANARANAERNRLQAVPGDACASAQVENREWLERRKADQ